MSLDEIQTAISKRDFGKFSKLVEELRSGGLLTPEKIKQIELIINKDLPASMRDVALSLLESENEDEKEREEKYPSLDPRNVCSSDTQKDLIGEPISSTLNQVITFLLKNKKSECITEFDMAKIVGEREDEIYLYDSESKKILTSVLVYRLPTSGIWIVGHPLYFRVFRAYQLESFGKHVISVEKHKISSVWRQEHELFLAKPIHWTDFSDFIEKNKAIPKAPPACMCVFNPVNSDWSETAKLNFPIDKCHWMIPTWNGLPIFLGEKCGELLQWSSKLKPLRKTSAPVAQFQSVDELLTKIRQLTSSIRSYTDVDVIHGSQRLKIDQMGAKINFEDGTIILFNDLFDDLSCEPKKCLQNLINSHGSAIQLQLKMRLSDELLNNQDPVLIKVHDESVSFSLPLPARVEHLHNTWYTIDYILDLDI
jgi:hypothetical protein